MNLWYCRISSRYGERFYTTMQYFKTLNKYQGDYLFSVYFGVRGVSCVGLGLFRLHESKNKLSTNRTQIGLSFLSFFAIYKGLEWASPPQCRTGQKFEFRISSEPSAKRVLWGAGIGPARWSHVVYKDVDNRLEPRLLWAMRYCLMHGQNSQFVVRWLLLLLSFTLELTVKMQSVVTRQAWSGRLTIGKQIKTADNTHNKWNRQYTSHTKKAEINVRSCQDTYVPYAKQVAAERSTEETASYPQE